MATIFATRGVLRRSDNTKIVFGRGSARTPLGELTTPPNPLVGLGGDTPSPFLTPSMPSASRPPKLKVWLRPWSQTKDLRKKDTVHCIVLDRKCRLTRKWQSCAHRPTFKPSLLWDRAHTLYAAAAKYMDR